MLLTKSEADRKKNTLCQLKGYCSQETVIYKATVSTNTNKRAYIGSTELFFKNRLRFLN